MALVALGLLVIWATTFKATQVSGTTDVWQQGLFALTGLVAFFFAARTDYRTWGKLTTWLYGLMIVLLLWVALFSKAVLGAQRWIDFGVFQFQPSELAKVVLIIVLAKFFAVNYEKLEKPKYLLMSLLILGVPMALVMRQPDLGTALVMGFIWLCMALVSRIRKLHLLILGGLGLAALPIAISHLKPFQRARLETFINPTSDPLHTGYNAVQSTITVGSGQIFGRGLGAGSQSQLNFLPSLAQHTDFIFAVLSEKMGFVGGVLLIGLFGVLIYRGIHIAYTTQDRFGMFIATGIVAMILFHVFINVGMNMAIAPVTGIPLPYVSYGGTGLIVMMFAAGILMSVAIRRKKLQFEG
ncbi:MAG: rod shape-determining protein RodA [Candidatus Saccharibacteria bacterium]|nr:rod shape-determining protein RodA [Candidatus Saccharibacteria bacterium]